MGHLLPVMIADPDAQEKRRVPVVDGSDHDRGRCATVEEAQVATDAV
jgi:hypothetical protein